MLPLRNAERRVNRHPARRPKVALHHIYGLFLRRVLRGRFMPAALRERYTCIRQSSNAQLTARGWGGHGEASSS